MLAESETNKDGEVFLRQQGFSWDIGFIGKEVLSYGLLDEEAVFYT